MKVIEVVVKKEGGKSSYSVDSEDTTCFTFMSMKDLTLMERQIRQEINNRTERLLDGKPEVGQINE